MSDVGERVKKIVVEHLGIEPNRVVENASFIDDLVALLQMRCHFSYPWWRSGPNGLVFFVRLGGKPIEFEKGKAGITVGSADKLPGLIDTLIAAVRSGELDDVLAQTAKGRTMPKRKAA